MAVTPGLDLTTTQLDGNLTRLRIDPRGAPPDLSVLSAIHLAHLETIPFENLDIVFGGGVAHDQLIAVDKLVGEHGSSTRGGWCFEVNGALALLLEALGFDVRLLGAAVLLDGPSQVIEHLLLEVTSPLLAPHLVDVGFGASFDLPLALNAAGPQDGGSGVFELIPSPQGTTLAQLVDGVPAALLRFKRVAHAFADFAPVSRSMQADPHRTWSTHPFATRRLTDTERGAGPQGGLQRVKLTRRRITIERGDDVSDRPVERERWAAELKSWFDMNLPGPWPATT